MLAQSQPTVNLEKEWFFSQLLVSPFDHESREGLERRRLLYQDRSLHFLQAKGEVSIQIVTYPMQERGCVPLHYTHGVEGVSKKFSPPSRINPSPVGLSTLWRPFREEPAPRAPPISGSNLVTCTGRGRCGSNAPKTVTG